MSTQDQARIAELDSVEFDADGKLSSADLIIRGERVKMVCAHPQEQQPVSQSSLVVPECSMLRKFDKPATLSQYGIGFYEGWNAYHDELTKTPAAAPSSPVETKEKP